MVHGDFKVRPILRSTMNFDLYFDYEDLITKTVLGLLVLIGTIRILLGLFTLASLCFFE
jgi:hypothetical protein